MVYVDLCASSVSFFYLTQVPALCQQHADLGLSPFPLKLELWFEFTQLHGIALPYCDLCFTWALDKRSTHNQVFHSQSVVSSSFQQHQVSSSSRLPIMSIAVHLTIMLHERLSNPSSPPTPFPDINLLRLTSTVVAIS